MVRPPAAQRLGRELRAPAGHDPGLGQPVEPGLDRAARHAERLLSARPEVRTILTNVGRDNPQIYYNVIPRNENAGVAQLFVTLDEYDSADTPAMLDTLLANVSEMIIERPGLLDLKNAENESMAATNLAADMLVDYRMWVDGMDREAAQRWLSTPEFIKDFSEALDRYRQSMEEPASE